MDKQIKKVMNDVYVKDGQLTDQAVNLLTLASVDNFKRILSDVFGVCKNKEDNNNKTDVKKCIAYRPCCGSYDAAMKKSKNFETLKEMFLFLVHDHSLAFSIDDLSIKYHGYDSRTKQETYVVLTRRYNCANYVEMFGCPQIIGFVHF